MMIMKIMMIMMGMVDLKVKLRQPRFPEQGLAEGFNWTKDKNLAWILFTRLQYCLLNFSLPFSIFSLCECCSIKGFPVEWIFEKEIEILTAIEEKPCFKIFQPDLIISIDFPLSHSTIGLACSATQAVGSTFRCWLAWGGIRRDAECHQKKFIPFGILSASAGKGW